MPRQKSPAICAVVLLSGGLDSTVALWWAKAQGYRCRALAFDYGQRHHRELQSARRVAKAARVSFSVVKFALPWGGSALTDKKQKLPNHSLKNIGKGPIPSTYVPARNTIFLSFGLSWADAVNAQAVVIGANAIDYSGYPDCRPRFLAAFEKTATLGTRQGTQNKKRIHIVAPLLRLTKKQIILLGDKLGAPMHLTWSCYQGGKKPCGVCDSCRLRERGFLDAGVKL